MSWKEDRDALIAQTMAFVQSVTGRREEAPVLSGHFVPAPVAELSVLPPSVLPPSVLPEAVLPELGLGAGRSLKEPLAKEPLPGPAAPIEPARIMEVSPAVAAITPRPITPSDMASEIRARVASFRAHQERFNREREQYFSATLERLRAGIKDMPAPPHIEE
jgi:hypothetical protein